MSGYYVLVDREPIEVDLITWAHHSEGRFDAEVDPWRVAETRLNDDYVVSTVFLGLDYNWQPGGHPLLFETMIFGRDDEEYCERCSTWDEALVQHRQAVMWAAEHGYSVVSGKLFGVL